MGLKMLHSADWHLDSPFSSFQEEQRANLRRAQMEIPGQIAMACRENGCDLVLLAGDLFDGPWTHETLDVIRDALAECRAPVFIAPGNHDPWGVDSPWGELWPDNVWIFPPKCSSTLVPELDCRVYGAGFSGMDCPPLLEGFRADGEEPYQIGVFHGDPTGGSSPYNPITTAQIRDSGLNYLALGHIHKAGGLEVGDTVCGWPGCPMGRGWDETGEKGYLLVEAGRETKVQPVLLDTPRFYQQNVEIGKDAAAALEAVLPPAGQEDFYRLTLTGYGKPDLAVLKRKFAAYRNLELRDRTVDLGGLWDQAGEDTLRGACFARLKARLDGETDPEIQRRILLAAEISQKLLEGREVQLP